MKTAAIRELRHETTEVLSWVAAGETVEVRRGKQPVALLSPPRARVAIARPDFIGRLQAIYGKTRLRCPGTEVISESRWEQCAAAG